MIFYQNNQQINTCNEFIDTRYKYINIFVKSKSTQNYMYLITTSQKQCS